MPSAFVLMPFSEEFKALYAEFIRPSLEKGGFGVKLADDINNDHNILRDIVEGIGDSQLVVADLTGSNPNVLYELGLAHALRKPVMHLTQSLDDVPFDLSSYRMLVYGTNFMEIREAKEKLEEKARVFLEGGSRFGNPITDFYQGLRHEFHGDQRSQRKTGRESSGLSGGRVSVRQSDHRLLPRSDWTSRDHGDLKVATVKSRKVRVMLVSRSMTRTVSQVYWIT